MTKKGKIKALTIRGYGFISQDSGEADIFFHASNLVNEEYKNLVLGVNVEYTIEESTKGNKAIDVVII